VHFYDYNSALRKIAHSVDRGNEIFNSFFRTAFFHPSNNSSNLKKITLIQIISFLILANLGLSPAQASTVVKEDFSTDEIIIKYKTLVSNTNESLEAEFVDQVLDKNTKAKRKGKYRKLRKLKKLKQLTKSEVLVIRLDQNLDKQEIKALVKKINSEKFHNENFEIETAHLNHLYEISATTSDALSSQQWALDVIDLDGLWQSTKGSGAVVAVIDTGVDYTHEDLAANIWVNEDEIANNGIDDDRNGFIDDVRGWDFIDKAGFNCVSYEDCDLEDNDPMDKNSHGTHVAGIIAAVQNNNKGISGIAPEAKIMPIRAGYSTGFSGYLKTDDIVEALTYAINNDADVINMSFAGYDLDVLQEVINLAHDLGIVCVAAAGNNSSTTKIYPAALDNVIAVGATADGTYKSYFSNSGSWVDIVAPGSWILSTIPDNQYSNKSGTSMASPMVAAVAALIKAKHKIQGISASEVEKLLLEYGSTTSFAQIPGSSLTLPGLSAAIDFPLQIDEIDLPTESLVGEAVSIAAKASDSFATVVAYEWTSDKDGYLSDEAAFSTANLSLGSHVVTVKAQNSQGQWSEPAFKIINVSETRSTGTLSIVDTIKVAIKKDAQRYFAQLSQKASQQIKAYKWISNKDGTVSEKRGLVKSSLSSGYHRLSLVIQDKEGNWSNPIERVIRI